MTNTDHWNEVYNKKAEAELSWHQDDPSVALDLMKMAGPTASSAVIDIGAGTSRLMDRLLDLGLSDLSSLDLSESGLAAARVVCPIEWSGLNVSAWSVSGLSGRCFRVPVDGIPERCAV